MKYSGVSEASRTKLFHNIIQQVCFPSVETSTCRRAFAAERFPVTANMLCTGPPVGGKDLFKVNSGVGTYFKTRRTKDSLWLTTVVYDCNSQLM